MATIKVKGTATRIFWNGRGVEVQEEYTMNGEGGEKVTATRKYTAWFEEAVNFEVNSFGTFEGNLSASMEKWVKDEQPVIDKRTGEQGISVKLAINNAKFEGNMQQRPQPTMTVITDQTPF
jgi:hypothetical protein